MYFGPIFFVFTSHTSAMTADVVLIATPKVFAVIPREPVSLKKYSVNASFFLRTDGPIVRGARVR